MGKRKNVKKGGREKKITDDTKLWKEKEQRLWESQDEE